MNWLLDTNLVLRFSDKRSAVHQTACQSLDSLFTRGESLHITAQNLIEFWAVATRPIEANGLGWTCDDTDAWITHLLTRLLFLRDSERVFSEWRSLTAGLAIKGKKVHDARLAAVMKAYNITHLLTFNTGDFARFAGIRAVHPDDVLAGRV